MRYKYIKINNDKVPLNKLDKIFTYEEIKNDEAVAILVEEPYIVLDMDDMNHFNCLCHIIDDLDIKCRIMRSDRGGHFWFKVPEPIQNMIDVNTPITLKTDVKCSGKKSLVTIKKNGKWREWLKEDESVDVLPFWLTPIKYKKDLYDLSDGDGRDSQLFSYIIPLLKLGYNKDQIYEIFNIINKYVFAESLKQSEIDKMFDENKIFEERHVDFFKGREFLHNIFADYMIEKFHIKGYGRLPYIYNGQVYKYDQDAINRAMIETVENLKRNQIQEAFENIRLKVTGNTEKLNPYIVNVKNGLYDLKTHTLLQHTPEIFTINQFNCKYDPEAYCRDVDEMLDNVTMKNTKLRDLIEEMLGYFLLGDCRFQKAFILLGQGSNGKSKFLDMITEWIGRENRSTLALEDLSEKFRTAELLGKIANIGDDSGGNILKNTAIFKKVVTGEGIMVERKNKDPFTLNNVAKMVFSVNNLPPSTDKSNGFFRRMIIIPFNAVFNKDNKNFDPNIIEKVTTEEARSYLFNLALKGYDRIMHDNFIEIPIEVEKIVDTYELDNNNVLQWIESNMGTIEGKMTSEVYTEYVLFCSNNNQIPVAKRKFEIEVMKRNTDLQIVTENNKVKWIKKEELD